jgi:hypothetical protein
MLHEVLALKREHPFGARNTRFAIWASTPIVWRFQTIDSSPCGVPGLKSLHLEKLVLWEFQELLYHGRRTRTVNDRGRFVRAESFLGRQRDYRRIGKAIDAPSHHQPPVALPVLSESLHEVPERPLGVAKRSTLSPQMR